MSLHEALYQWTKCKNGQLWMCQSLASIRWSKRCKWFSPVMGGWPCSLLLLVAGLPWMTRISGCIFARNTPLKSLSIDEFLITCQLWFYRMNSRWPRPDALVYPICMDLLGLVYLYTGWRKKFKIPVYTNDGRNMYMEIGLLAPCEQSN